MIRLGTAILLALVAHAALTAGNQARGESLPEFSAREFSELSPPPEFRPPWPPRSEHRPPPYSRGQFPPRDSLQTDAGYVFLNGEYLEPPYHITARDNKIEVNGHATNIELPATQRDGEYNDRPRRRRRGPSFVDRVPPQFIQLQYGSVLVLNENAPPIALDFGGIGKKLLKAINDPTKRADFFGNGERAAIPGEEHARWQQWLASYSPPPVLRERSEREIESFESELASAELRALSYRILEQWNRPLNICGFVLVLAASGHLFFSAPFPAFAIRTAYAWSRPALPLGMSLGFVLVLSALDLLWTVLMSQAGLMEEANPLARLFIDDPSQLAIFKSVFTFGAIAIIAGLHRFRPAQVGAWWACLICTLLATRWLVFHTLSV